MSSCSRRLRPPGVPLHRHSLPQIVVDGALVALHDYGHPDFPGVAEAVRELGIEGDATGGIFSFVH